MAIINHTKLVSSDHSGQNHLFFSLSIDLQGASSDWPPSSKQASIFRVLVCGEWHWLIGAISFFSPVIGRADCGEWGVVGWSKFSMKGLHKSPEWDTLIGEKTVFLHVTASYTESRANVLKAAMATGMGENRHGLKRACNNSHKATRKMYGSWWVMLKTLKTNLKYI